jgi:hypothetical protein
MYRRGARTEVRVVVVGWNPQDVGLGGRTGRGREGEAGVEVEEVEVEVEVQEPREMDNGKVKRFAGLPSLYLTDSGFGPSCKCRFYPHATQVEKMRLLFV